MKTMEKEMKDRNGRTYVFFIRIHSFHLKIRMLKTLEINWLPPFEPCLSNSPVTRHATAGNWVFLYVTTKMDSQATGFKTFWSMTRIEFLDLATHVSSKQHVIKIN